MIARHLSPDFRFVVYHETYGVFLGVARPTTAEGYPVLIWSKSPESKNYAKAPVFPDRAALEKYLDSFGKLSFPVNFQMQEAWDKDKDGFVTEEEVANAGLPRWLT